MSVQWHVSGFLTAVSLALGGWLAAGFLMPCGECSSTALAGASATELADDAPAQKAASPKSPPQAAGAAGGAESKIGGAEKPGSEKPNAAEKQGSAEKSGAAEKTSDDAKPGARDSAGLVKLSKTFDVWIHPERKLVVVDGQVCLREGPLEMFACPKRSKEHESLVSVNSDAKTVHTALLAIGAKSGSPVKFNPQFAAASGTPVEITILWTDKDGKQHKQRAQEWIRHVRTKKQLESTWVFAGSSFWFDEETKQQMYQADAGDLVCVSNFPTATLDLPVESSQANADLEFEAFSERIPPLGTKIRLVFQPKLPAAAAPQTEKTEKAGK